MQDFMKKQSRASKQKIEGNGNSERNTDQERKDNTIISLTSTKIV